MTATETAQLAAKIEEAGFPILPMPTAGDKWNVMVTFGEEQILVESWEEFEYYRDRYAAGHRGKDL